MNNDDLFITQPPHQGVLGRLNLFAMKHLHLIAATATVGLFVQIGLSIALIVIIS